MKIERYKRPFVQMVNITFIFKITNGVPGVVNLEYYIFRRCSFTTNLILNIYSLSCTCCNI